MKAIHPLISASLILLIALTSLTLFLTLIKPSLQKAWDSWVVNSLINEMERFFWEAKELVNSGEGSFFTFTFNQIEGKLRLNSSNELIYFKYSTPLKLRGIKGNVRLEGLVSFIDFFNSYPQGSSPPNWNCEKCEVKDEKLLLNQSVAYKKLKSLEKFYFSSKIEGFGQSFLLIKNPSNLKLFLTFDEGEGCLAFDFSKFNNSATLGNSSCGDAYEPKWQPSEIFGYALNFDGIDDYVNAGNSSTLNPNQSLSLEVWVKLFNISNTQYILSKSDGSSGYLLYFNSTSKTFGFGFYDSNSIFHFVDSLPIEANRWYHLLGSYDGNYLRIFVDGKLENEVKVAGYIKGSINPLIIGNDPNKNFPLNGSVDEVKVYNVSFSLEEVEVEYELSKKKLDQKINKQAILKIPNFFLILSSPLNETYFDEVKVYQEKEVIMGFLPLSFDLETEVLEIGPNEKIRMENAGIGEKGKPVVKIEYIG